MYHALDLRLLARVTYAGKMTPSEADRAIEHVRLELHARKASVAMTGVIGVWVGIAMILSGAPDFIENWFSPWSRVFLGLLSFIPGVLTAIGAYRSDRDLWGWWIQIVGLLGLCVWYAAMAVAYIGLLLNQGPQFAELGEPLPPQSTGRGYVPLLYIGLLSLSVFPLWVLIKIGRPPR